MDAAISGLLTAVHKMTGGLGVTINTCTRNGKADDYKVEVVWRRRYRNVDGTFLCDSKKRRAFGYSLEDALRNALDANKEMEEQLHAALGAHPK